ncbi:MAG: PilZ domain-containing protein [Hyphomicrobiales bacterium]
MSEAAEKITEERRAMPRTRALKKGVIAFKDRYCSTECMVRNESDDGALLVVSQNQVIPNMFELKVHPDRDFRIAEAIWRTPDAMGIRYVKPKAVEPTAHSTWDGVERRGPQNRRQSDRRD